MIDVSSVAALKDSVSRETRDHLERYVILLAKWQKALNLVSNLTLAESWKRHILDSAQLVPLARNDARHWADLGSGAGFPGLVCAILARETHPSTRFTLVESDARKCVFLREVARQTGISVEILNDRVEAIEPLNADILSARALAPLSALLSYASPHLAQNGTCLFLKGARYDTELEQARTDWHMDVERVLSVTSPDAVILIVRELSHAAPT